MACSILIINIPGVFLNRDSCGLRLVQAKPATSTDTFTNTYTIGRATCLDEDVLLQGSPQGSPTLDLPLLATDRELDAAVEARG